MEEETSLKEMAEKLATDKELLENDTSLLAEEKEKLMKVGGADNSVPVKH